MNNSMQRSGVSRNPGSKYHSAVAAKARRNAAPFIMIFVLIIAILSVLLVPMLVGGAAAPASSSRSVSVVTPKVDSYTSISAAERALGFKPPVPRELAEGYVFTAVRVVDDTMLELEYTSDTSVVLFRVAEGKDDLSGLETEFAYTTTETVGEVTRSYSGVSEQKFSVAVWADEGYTYALVAESGVSSSVMRLIAESVG